MLWLNRHPLRHLLLESAPLFPQARTSLYSLGGSVQAFEDRVLNDLTAQQVPVMSKFAEARLTQKAETFAEKMREGLHA
jgi:hypothetical protein